MSSPIAVIGLFYDDFDIQQADGQIFAEIERGIVETPRVRGRDSITPGADGRSERNRKNDTLQIILRVHVTADPLLTDLNDIRASYRANVATVRNLFRPARPRALLEALLEDDTLQTISARPINIIGATTVAGEYRELSVELEGYADWAVGGS